MIATLAELPSPACRLGYSVGQLATAMDAQQFARLEVWMGGQTMALCDGRRYDHERKVYVPTCPSPHGVVIYAHDVDAFLRAAPITD